MSPVRTIAAALAALSTTGALSSDVDQDAIRNGYERLPPLLIGESGSGAADTAPVYVKVIEPRRKLSILDLGAKREKTNELYSLVSFEIDCSKNSMRYRAVQLIELPWNPRGSNTPVKSPWHTPTKDSGPQRALAFACKA
jgi:hypothetical protein